MHDLQPEPDPPATTAWVESLSSLPPEKRPTLAIIECASTDKAAQMVSDLTIDDIATLPGTGGAESFIAALRNELLPQILKAAAIEPEHMVFHTSGIGSAVAFQVLFHHPNLFDHLWIESPSMTFHRTFAMKAEYAFHRKGLVSLPRKVLLTSLSNEPDEDSLFPLTIFTLTLDRRGYQDLDVTWLNGRDLQVDSREDMQVRAIGVIY